MLIGWLAIALTATAFPQNHPGPPDPSDLADAIQRHYDSLRTLKADFVQIYHSAFSEEEESGVLYLKKPGRMRWEYRKPTEKLFVADGRKTYFYVPRDRQVSVGDWQSEPASTPLLFLLGQGNLRNDFDVSRSSEAKIGGGDTLLLLTPKKENASFKSVLLEVRDTDASIVRLSILESGGNQNDYLLQAVQENLSLPDDKFRFKVPKGVEVLGETR